VHAGGLVDRDQPLVLVDDPRLDRRLARELHVKVIPAASLQGEAPSTDTWV
jgi:hypothetical protein